MGYERFGLSKLAADKPYNVDIAHFAAAADVVYFAVSAAVDNKVNGGAVVGNVYPVPDIFAASVDGQGLVGKGIRYHQRDKLFGVLARTVIV